jgi:hypothetical protein
MPEDYKHRRKDRNHTVVLAGSYNPPHSGHMAMIRYLSERYVMKENGTLFFSVLMLDQRKRVDCYRILYVTCLIQYVLYCF